MKPNLLRLFRLSLATAALLAALPAGAASLVIANRSNVNTLDPHMSASVGTDLSLLSHIYPALLLRGPDLKLHGNLADSWEAVNDTTWRFKLKPGATFTNGEKLDAETVKWNLDRVRDPKVNARIKAWFDLVKDVRVIDPLTIEVETSSPYPAFADQLSMFFLLPPKWASENNPATTTQSGGPYILTENVPGSGAKLKANPDYWGDKPAFDEVEFRIIPEAASRVAALQAGEVDLITGIPTAEVKRINDAGRATAGAIPSTRSVFIKFNTEKAPLDNKLVRQALNYAIDKQGIVDAIFDKQAVLSNGQVLSKDYFGYNPDLQPYAYDPAKARELLKQAGIAPGTTLELEIPTNVYLQGEEVGQIVAAQLADVGLNVRINEFEFGNWMNKYLQRKDLGQLSVLGQAWPTIDADGLLTLFAPGNMYAYWNDARFGELLEQGRSTTDEATRTKAYREATSLMREEAPALFLYVQPQTYGVSKRVDWQARGDDWIRAYDLRPHAAK